MGRSEERRREREEGVLVSVNLNVNERRFWSTTNARPRADAGGSRTSNLSRLERDCLWLWCQDGRKG